MRTQEGTVRERNRAPEKEQRGERKAENNRDRANSPSPRQQGGAGMGRGEERWWRVESRGQTDRLTVEWPPGQRQGLPK